MRFTKLGKVRFVSHRDLARVWERALRRAEVPVAYSSGFSPRPRFHFGLALSVGHESHAEYLDFDLADTVRSLDDFPLAGLAERFSAVLPNGVDCSAVALLDDADKLSLQEAVTSSSWTIALDGGSLDQAAAALDALLAAEQLVITRERKGKAVSDDIRPYVRSLHLDADASDPDHGVVFHAEIGTQPRALRPAELIGALGPDWRERRVCRLAQWIEHDGRRREPLTLATGVASWTRTELCAT